MNKLLAGFTAGLIVGILFAPARGSETRRSIARKGNELKDQFNDFVDSISERFDSVREEAEDFADTAKRKIKAAKSDLAT